MFEKQSNQEMLNYYKNELKRYESMQDSPIKQMNIEEIKRQIQKYSV